MKQKIVVQVFVSCPYDASAQKDIIKNLCDTLNNAGDGITDIIFEVKDWRDFVGRYGSRPQEQINDNVGLYDVYIGILWKRFGTPPGSKNPSTGGDVQSGTEEEFLVAVQRWKHSKMPDIHLFIRTDKRESSSLAESEQLGKVFRFIEEQQQSNNNFINEFKEDEFSNKVLQVLIRKQLSVTIQSYTQQRQEVIKDIDIVDIQEYRNAFQPQSEYVSRALVHYKSWLLDPKGVYSTDPEPERLDILLNTHKRIVVLGDAGSGKSTELENLAFIFSNKDSPYLPTFQRLNTYSPDQGLENSLPEYWRKIPQHLLLILWDGLDEIEPSHFNTAIRQIKVFSIKYPDVRIVISCRTNFYNLPLSDSPSTLPDFDPFFIPNLEIKDVRKYYSTKFKEEQAEAFIANIQKNGLEDLTTRPYFLMILAEIYSDQNRLPNNKAELYQSFILYRLNQDKAHFQGVFDIRPRKEEIMSLLERVALSMEILARNFIVEEELLQLISSNEYTTIKYCTVFKKKEGSDSIWQFEHNNIQEYLAASSLSKLSFEKTIQLIAFEPEYKKLIPTWINTLTFLVSILSSNEDQLTKLLSWLLEYEKEVIVKFEREKIPKDRRTEIFKSIFNYYKGLNAWIQSSSFSTEELARFGQSDNNINFLISEIQNRENSRVTKINAIDLLGHFDYCQGDNKRNVQVFLMGLIDEYSSDDEIIRTIVYSLKSAGMNEAGLIADLMKKLKHRKNQHIRSALYSILSSSEIVDEYFDYLVEGIGLDRKNGPDRHTITLADESWNLKECFLAIKTVSGLAKLIDYIANTYHFDYLYDSKTFIDRIVDNSIVAYKQDHLVYDKIFRWYQKEIKGFDRQKADRVCRFFDETSTRKRAFAEVWSWSKAEQDDKTVLLAKLITEDDFMFVINEYWSRNITNADLKKLLSDMYWLRNPLAETFENVLKKEIAFVIEKPKQAAIQALQVQKEKENFDILFDSIRFRDAVAEIFDKERKEHLTYEDLYEIRKESHRQMELDDYYNGAAVRLLRNFNDAPHDVKKEEILAWFDNEEMVEWYCAQIIYEHLVSQPTVDLSSEQNAWIKTWCKKNEPSISFRTALTVSEDGKRSYIMMAIYIYYFSARLDIQYGKEVYLDMLSFDCHLGGGWLGIEYPLSKLHKKDIEARIVLNIKAGIRDNKVFKNQAAYAIKNRLSIVFPNILKEIVNTSREVHERNEILDIYCQGTEDTNGLKALLPDAPDEIRWKIVEKLVLASEYKVVIEFTSKVLDGPNSQDEKVKAAEFLMELQQIEGLEFITKLVQSKANIKLTVGNNKGLATLKTKKAVFLLLELLHISYQEDVKINIYESLLNSVIIALQNIALIGQDNFQTVVSGMEGFIQNNKMIYPNANFLTLTVDRIKAQFYLNKAKSYTIKQVKEKLRFLNDA
jgi:hypothetical protein